MMSSICAGAAEPGLLSISQDLVEQMKILLLLGGRVNQARIRGRILRFEFPNRLEVAGIGHDLGKLLELLELSKASFQISFLQQLQCS